jgi:hypothetical protein
MSERSDLVSKHNEESHEEDEDRRRMVVKRTGKQKAASYNRKRQKTKGKAK